MYNHVDVHVINYNVHNYGLLVIVLHVKDDKLCTCNTCSYMYMYMYVHCAFCDL